MPQSVCTTLQIFLTHGFWSNQILDTLCGFTGHLDSEHSRAAPLVNLKHKPDPDPAWFAPFRTQKSSSLSPKDKSLIPQWIRPHPPGPRHLLFPQPWGFRVSPCYPAKSWRRRLAAEHAAQTHRCAPRGPRQALAHYPSLDSHSQGKLEIVYFHSVPKLPVIAQHSPYNWQIAWLWSLSSPERFWTSLSSVTMQSPDLLGKLAHPQTSSSGKQRHILPIPASWTPSRVTCTSNCSVHACWVETDKWEIYNYKKKI